MPGPFVPQSTPPSNAPADVQVYFGQATETGCRVYATWDAAERGAAEPQAFLSGPESPYATTLRARYPLARRLGTADQPAEAWIAEPCFWTPAAPYVYRYEIRFPDAPAPITGLLGIRRLAVRGDHLVFDRKHWVLRGALASPVTGETLSISAWHDAPLAALVVGPSERLCEEASRLGMLVVARVTCEDVAAELRRLARWPAVGIAVLTATAVGDDPRQHARNLLLAQYFSATEAIEPTAWAQLVLCEVGDTAEFVRRVAGCQLPVVAVRPDGQCRSPSAARAACDRLQRDLAAVGMQMAGYLV